MFPARLAAVAGMASVPIAIGGAIAAAAGATLAMLTTILFWTAVIGLILVALVVLYKLVEWVVGRVRAKPVARPVPRVREQPKVRPKRRRRRRTPRRFFWNPRANSPAAVASGGLPGAVDVRGPRQTSTPQGHHVWPKFVGGPDKGQPMFGARLLVHPAIHREFPLVMGPVATTLGTPLTPTTLGNAEGDFIPAIAHERLGTRRIHFGTHPLLRRIQPNPGAPGYARGGLSSRTRSFGGGDQSIETAWSIALFEHEQPNPVVWARVAAVVNRWNASEPGTPVDRTVPGALLARFTAPDAAAKDRLLALLDDVAGAALHLVPLDEFDEADFAAADFVAVRGHPGCRPQRVRGARRRRPLSPVRQERMLDVEQVTPFVIDEEPVVRTAPGLALDLARRGLALTRAQADAWEAAGLRGADFRPVLDGATGRPSYRLVQLAATTTVLLPCPRHTQVAGPAHCPGCGRANGRVEGWFTVPRAAVGDFDVVSRHPNRIAFLFLSRRALDVLGRLGQTGLDRYDVLRLCEGAHPTPPDLGRAPDSTIWASDGGPPLSLNCLPNSGDPSDPSTCPGSGPVRKREFRQHLRHDSLGKSADAARPAELDRIAANGQRHSRGG